MFDDKKKHKDKPVRPTLSSEERQRIYDSVSERQWKAHSQSEWVAIAVEDSKIIAGGDYSSAEKQASQAGHIFFLVRSKYFGMATKSGSSKSVA